MLTRHQRLFCREYLIDLNVTGAARRAGCKAYQGIEFMKMPDVLDEVERLMCERSRRTDITGDRVLQEAAKSAFLDPLDLYDDQGQLLPLNEMPEHARRAIASIEEDKNGNRKIKFVSKEAMLVALGRNLRLFVDRVEVEGTQGLADRLLKAKQRAQSRSGDQK